MKPAVLRNLFPLAMLVAVALACSSVQKGIESAAAPKTITSSDGKVQLTVPATWTTETGLNAQATLQAANKLSEMYVIVIGESKQDFPKGFTLDKFASIVHDQMKQKANATTATDPSPTTVGGNPAMRYELQGTVSNINVAYINTVVETPNGFYQILTWTLPSKLSDNRATLEQVAGSFKELSAPAASSSAPASSNTSGSER